MPDATTIILPIAAVLISAAALGQTVRAYRYSKSRDAGKDHSRELAAITARLDRYEQEQVELFRLVAKLEGSGEATLRILDFYASKTLHRHGDELGIDYYLDKPELEPDEAQEFVNRLADIIESTEPDGTKVAAAIKLAAVVRHYQDYNLTIPGLEL